MRKKKHRIKLVSIFQNDHGDRHLAEISHQRGRKIRKNGGAARRARQEHPDGDSRPAAQALDRRAAGPRRGASASDNATAGSAVPLTDVTIQWSEL